MGRKVRVIEKLLQASMMSVNHTEASLPLSPEINDHRKTALLVYQTPFHVHYHIPRSRTILCLIFYHFSTLDDRRSCIPGFDRKDSKSLCPCSVVFVALCDAGYTMQKGAP